MSFLSLSLSLPHRDLPLDLLLLGGDGTLDRPLRRQVGGSDGGQALLERQRERAVGAFLAQGVGESGPDGGLGARLGDGCVRRLARREHAEPDLGVVVELGRLDGRGLRGELGGVGLDDGV